MTNIYEEYLGELSGTSFIKRINEDGSISFIPKDEANADYQAYLNKDKPVEHFTPNLAANAD